MDSCVDLCLSFGLPAWMALLLHAAKRLRSDVASRRKVYRLLQRRLRNCGVGVSADSGSSPTYVYPDEVKRLVRSVFPQDVCGYQDPTHPQTERRYSIPQILRDPRAPLPEEKVDAQRT